MSAPGARALRTACPRCGGTVARSEGSRAERCPYCETRSLLLTEEVGELRYSLPVRLDAEGLPRATGEQLVAKGVLTPRIARRAVVGEPTLFFVPYLWLTASRPGLVARNVSRADTRVVIDDFEAFSPAVDIPGWGLSAFDPSSLLARTEAPPLQPFDGGTLRRAGIVLSPQQGFAGLERWAWGSTGEPARPVVAPRRRLLYVPIWSVPYRVGSRSYEARLEAVSGELLAARGPEDPRWRVPVALAAIALPSFLLGRTLAALLHVGGPHFMPESLSFLLALLLAAGLFLAGGLAWSLLRYEAEHLYEVGSLLSKRLGASRESLFDRGAALVGSLLDSTREAS